MGPTFIGLKYGVGKETGAHRMGCVDSDYAGDLDTRRSLIGHNFKVCGNTISWKANLQLMVALSMTVVEYIVAIEVVKEAMWLWGLVKKVGIRLEHMKAFCDS